MPGQCKFKNCEKKAYFAFSKPALYCNGHKEDKMVNVYKPSCPCGKRANYGYDKPTHCRQCKEDKMIDLTNSKCKCGNRALYSLAKGYKPSHCSNCKTENMIDVSNKRCIKCNKRPTYGYLNKNSICCKEHKSKDMFDLHHKTCKKEGCLTRPCFNLPNEKNGYYCDYHKTEGMINVVDRRCKSEWCDTIVSRNKFDGFCSWCFIHQFPDHILSRNYKTKESEVAEYIKSKFSSIDLHFDKKIQDSCSNRRPDIYIDMGSHLIIIEIDENQHTGYEQICENRRTMEISKGIEHRYLVMIRFNPDGYINEKGSKIPTCWRNTKNGTVLVKTRIDDWNLRLNTLKKTLKYWLKNEPQKTIEIVKLFYNCN